MSITNIRVTPKNLTMTYEDLKDNKQYVSELAIEKRSAGKEQPALPRFLALKSFLIRLFNWEFWSFNTVYTPIMYYWFWLSFKSRSFFFLIPQTRLLRTVVSLWKANGLFISYYPESTIR